jgi:hypothetical protein
MVVNPVNQAFYEWLAHYSDTSGPFVVCRVNIMVAA